MTTYIKIVFDSYYGDNAAAFVVHLTKRAFRLREVCCFESERDFNGELNELALCGKTPIAFLRLNKQCEVDMLYVHIVSDNNKQLLVPSLLLSDIGIDVYDLLQEHGEEHRRHSP